VSTANLPLAVALGNKLCIKP